RQGIARHSRCGHADVDEPVLSRDLVENLAPCGLIGGVTNPGDGQRATVRFIDRTGDIEDLFTAIHQNDGPGEAVGQFARSGLADAAARAGYQSDFVLDLHGSIPLVNGEWSVSAVRTMDRRRGPLCTPPLILPLTTHHSTTHQFRQAADFFVNSIHFVIAAWKSRVWASNAWRRLRKQFCHSSMVLARSSSSVLASQI